MYRCREIESRSRDTVGKWPTWWYDLYGGKPRYTEFNKILNSITGLNVNNIISITRDNASNNNSFINIYKNKAIIYDIRCTAHILNLIIQDILQDYILNVTAEKAIIEFTDNINNNTIINTTSDSIITKIRKLATLVKYTQENRKLFIEDIDKYKKEGIIPSNYNINRIPLDNSTRWNSTYFMIKTALELKQPLIYTANLTSNKDFKQYLLSDLEWFELKELKNIFEIFLKPTIKLQGQIYTTLNYSLLYIYQLYNKLEKLISIYKQQKSGNFSSYILAIKSRLKN